MANVSDFKYDDSFISQLGLSERQIDNCHEARIL